MIQLTIDWWKLCEIAKASPDNYTILREVRPTLPPLEDVLANKGYANFEAFINDPSELPDFVIESSTWKPIKPLKFVDGRKPNAMEIKEAMMVHQVHLPGNELLKIRHVHVEEDCCTEVLQGKLDAGWKIIAVCPQASRRPDYILGKELL